MCRIFLTSLLVLIYVHYVRESVSNKLIFFIASLLTIFSVGKAALYLERSAKDSI